MHVRPVDRVHPGKFVPGTGAVAAMEDSSPRLADNGTAVQQQQQQAAEAQRFRKQSKKIGRKLSRRLSLIAKVPNIFNVKFTGNAAETPTAPTVPQKIADAAVQTHEITVIAPDKTQRFVSTSRKRKFFWNFRGGLNLTIWGALVRSPPISAYGITRCHR